MIPEPSTGSVRTRRIDAERIVHENKQAKTVTIPVERAMSNEAMNVIEPPSEERPRTWRAKIATETAEDEEYELSERGAYRVHPADTPSSRERAKTKSIEAATRE